MHTHLPTPMGYGPMSTMSAGYPGGGGGVGEGGRGGYGTSYTSSGGYQPQPPQANLSSPYGGGSGYQSSLSGGYAYGAPTNIPNTIPNVPHNPTTTSASVPASTQWKGIYRFENGIKVNEFRDLRANPRCLIESQVVGMRVRWMGVVGEYLNAYNASSSGG